MGACNSPNNKKNSNSIPKKNNPIKNKNKSRTPTQTFKTLKNNDNLLISNNFKIGDNQKIYGIKKFGVNIKPDKDPLFPLHFIFHMSKVKCKMLLENQIYILLVKFDNNEYPLCIASGKNPKFIFNESFEIKIEFDKLEETFLEITIYSHSLIDNPQKLNSLTKGEILNESQKYSSFKIDLLTLAIAPEHHDIALYDLKKSHLLIGRISYTITCKHIENVICKIDSFKFNINSLINTDLCLKLKFFYDGLSKEKETQYTQFIQGNPIQKDNITSYEFSVDENDKINELILKNKLSITELRNADVSLNIYSGRLVEKNEDCKIKKKNISVIKRTHTSFTSFNIFQRNNIRNKSNSRRPSIVNNDLSLVQIYTLVGTAQLNFYNILNSHENRIVKRSSKFFKSIKHNQKLNLIYDEKEHKYKRGKSFDNLNNANENDDIYYLELFEDIYEHFSDNLYYKGNLIGNFEMNLSLINIPLIKQIMCGVMTETGFEPSSIFLYDNIITNDNFPEDLIKLIKLKNSLDNYFTNKVQLKKGENVEPIKLLNGIKECLNKGFEDSVLYYPYSNNLDLFKGQGVMLELGLNILELIDKLNMEERKVSFEILKLLTERDEFGLSIISSKWFKENQSYKNNKMVISYEFFDEYLINKKVVENFIRFINEATHLCLESITRGKNNDKSTTIFTNYFLSIAYFRVPLYREYFIKSILANMDIKNKYHQKLIKNNVINVDELMEQDPINTLILWDDLYKKLNSAINNMKGDSAIDIKEMLSEMKDMISYSNDYGRNDWKNRLSKRDFVFFNIVKNLCEYIKSEILVDNEINDNDEIKLHWKNIPGFDLIIYCIENELKTLEVKNYPNSLMNLIPIFIENVDIVNNFILLIIKKTNAYDTNAVFNFVNILDLIFSQKKMKSSEIQFNYNIIQQAFIITMNTENSLSISKFILFYYKNAHLIPMKHLINIVNIIFIPNFFNFFFHWSFQIREVFYYILLYIFEYRLKDRIAKVSNFKTHHHLNRVQTQNDASQFFSNSGTKQTNFGDLFDPYIKVIKNIENIIYTEELEPVFKDHIDDKQFSNALQIIPKEVRKNIVISMTHYDDVFNNFILWKEKNKNTNINIDDYNYPEIDVVPVKDDVVEYTTEEN